jgi:ABC-type glycerol-3-phosphate transport system substrate-binding protein
MVVATEGANGIYQTMLRETTGVNVEYQTIDYTSAQQAFSVMLASSDFTDIMGGVAGVYGFWGAAGGGTSSDMIDQKFFANIADYRAYAPNFMYQIPRFDFDPELINAIWLNDTMITNMGPYIENPLPGTGFAIRGDWIDQLEGAPAAADIHTYDQLHDVLTRFKTEGLMADEGYPIFFPQAIELQAGVFFGGMNTALMNTAPAIKVVDGTVGFTLTQDIDYDALNLFLTWLDEGLIDPAYTELPSFENARDKLYSDGYGMISINPSEVEGLERYNVRTPDSRWDALPASKLTEDFVIKYAHANGRYSYVGGGWAFKANGANVPLAISYADWFYSEDGSFIGSYGVEGTSVDDPNTTYFYDDTGKVLKTNFVLNDASGRAVSYVMLDYQQLSFSEPIRHVHLGNYAIEGGERMVQFFYTWVEDYYAPTGDGSLYDWPSAAAKPTDEQQRELNGFLTDTNTWFSENYALFFDKTTPLSRDTWNTYVNGLMDAGYARYQLIMQNVYDDYMAKREEQLA